MAKQPNIENLFIYLAIYAEFVPGLCLLLFFKKVNKERPLGVILIYSLLFALAGIIDLYDLTPTKSYKIYFYSAITLFEYSLFCCFLLLIIKNNIVKRYILFSIFAFALFHISYTYLSPNLYFDSIPIGIETILILIFSIYFLYEQINNPQIIFIYNNYRFWIIAGFMIYLSGSFFIYILAYYIPRSQLAFYWQFIDIFLILKNIFFTIGILVFALQPKIRKLHSDEFYQNTFLKP